jgi:osmotically-inducible protein OsmY
MLVPEIMCVSKQKDVSMKRLRLNGFSAALVLSCALAVAGQATAPGVPDSTITANVQGLFASHGVAKASNITVTSVQGVVELSGTVYSKATKDEALYLVGKVGGVKSVNDQLAIDEVPDGTIVAEIKDGFAANGVLKVTNIQITAVQGVVTLNGTAVAASAKLEAFDVAKRARGVRNVINNVVARP